MAILMEGSFSGTNVEIRTATLASNTIEVPTRFSKVLAVSFMFDEAPGAGSQPVCDKVITAGKITVADAGVAAKDITVIIFGLM